MFDIEVIEDLADGLMDDVVDGLRPMIKGWYGRQDTGAIICDRRHQPEVSFMKSGFPSRQEPCFSFFFQSYIRGTDQKVACIGVGNAGESLYGAE